MADKKIIKEVISLIRSGLSVESAKRKVMKKHGLSKFIKNSDILPFLPKDDPIYSKLIKRPMRTISGVTPIAIMIKPENSCKWSCIYCPIGKGAKSYTGEEPAALRARQCNFDPAEQTKVRLKHYLDTGHPADKCEIIVMGGTFLAMDKSYKDFFIKSIYDTLNSKPSKDIPDAKRINETAKHRVVGLTIETRPDVCSENDINEMLYFGATRVELGVQMPSDRIYKLIRRGHTVSDVIQATKNLKNTGYKICYHIMPGLPGSDKTQDIYLFKKLFSDPSFRPDMLKIYPTLVVKGSQLYNIWKQGGYKPYSTEEAADVISEFYRFIPEYVRVMRIQRDIPTPLIEEGVLNSNLRQIVEQKAEEKDIEIREIRYREIKDNSIVGKPMLSVETYFASGGKEFFISYSDEADQLLGFLRLRFPDTSFRKEIDSTTAIVRELHVYGKEASIGGSSTVQHKGLGSKLLEEAEEIAKSNGKSKILIISGAGVRGYYRKKGYHLIGPYMGKKI